MNDMSLKYYKRVPLILIILFLSWSLDLFIKEVLLPVLHNFHLDAFRIPSNAIIIGGLLVFYNRVLWKLPFFNLLVQVPDMNGRYEGKIEYEWENKPTRKNCVVEVHQNATRIHLSFFFNDDKGQKTNSSSKIAEIRKEPDGYNYIYIFYLNEGSKTNKKLDSHEGANILKFLPAKEQHPAKLTGHYFTSRNPQSKGKMEVKFLSKETKGEF